MKKKTTAIGDYIKRKTSFPGLTSIEVETFFKRFGEMNPHELVAFIDDPCNSYAIGEFVYYNTEAHRYYAYNGKSLRYKCVSTLNVSQ